MPKVLSESPTASLSKNSSGGTLKRNQACHQCRRRKLKCDAKRPCSTCVRSHSHALVHAPQDAYPPPSPECTFDDVSDIGTPDGSPKAPENQYEHLERRILELEALLKEKQDTIASFVSSPVDPAQYSISSNLAAPFISAPTSQNFNGSRVNDHTDLSITNDSLSVLGVLNGLMGAIPTELDILWPKWPRHLPPPGLLRHIVDTFFACHPHGARLFHKPTFLASLSLPPDHPEFPSPPILHALCAAGSLYTSASSHQQGSDTHDYAEQQAMLAKSQIDEYLMNRQKLFQCLQATVILSWYYWGHARWIELFISTGQLLRIAVPLGLNMCPPFHALNATVKSMSIVPTPSTLVEDEARRNAFWLAYAIDRQYGAGNGWAMSLDDNDIAQLLPLPRAKLDAGIPVSAELRQWSHLRESFFVHPPDLTDSFTLYIKVMMIISRIKSFNHRFRILEHLGDPGSQTTRLNRWNEPDIRSTPTFSQLDDVIGSFRSALSHEFKDPFVNNSIDPHLYTTHLALHASIILLHEPHSMVTSNICTSAMKILHAAREILELVYLVLSTNFDLGHVDLFCPFCWFLAGRIFGRFLKAAQDADITQQIEALKVEIVFIRTALEKMGERIPLAARYLKMLDACILDTCGPSVDRAVVVPVNGVPVRTVVDDFLLSRVVHDQAPAYDLGTFMRLYNGFMGDV